MAQGSSSSLAELATQALSEISQVFTRADELKLDPLGATVEEMMLARHNNIVVYGVGREGLMLKSLAMRLFHLGLHASCAGDMTTPNLGHGDLLVVSAGPGSFATVEALARVASDAGARVLLFTAQPATSLPVTRTVVLPARTMADDVGADSVGLLPMGSAYEAALFVLFEIVVLELRKILLQTPASMRARHTNLE